MCRSNASFRAKRHSADSAHRLVGRESLEYRNTDPNGAILDGWREDLGGSLARKTRVSYPLFTHDQEVDILMDDVQRPQDEHTEGEGRGDSG